jgi:hypothetical protein
MLRLQQAPWVVYALHLCRTRRLQPSLASRRCAWGTFRACNFATLMRAVLCATCCSCWLAGRRASKAAYHGRVTTDR